MHDPNALQKITAKQFQRWMIYEKIEPFGELRADYRAAQVAYYVAGNKETKIEDFLLKFNEKRHKQTVEEQIRAFKIIAMTFAVPGVDE